jgi:tRNA dimethylallyltransferase
MIPSRLMTAQILIIAGPTASGKSSRSVEEALLRGGEIISVDSRQVYRGLNIGTEKITAAEMRGVPHHLIDIRDPQEKYSAGDFVTDATRLIADISARGKVPILAGGTHFYFDALINGLTTGVDANPALREELEKLPDEELAARVAERDPRRASELDPKNRRRLIRALEIINSLGFVPPRSKSYQGESLVIPHDLTDPAEVRLPQQLRKSDFRVEWIVIDPPREELRARIDTRLQSALERGLIDEVRHVRELVGDARLDELGLEYRIIGEYLREQDLEVGLPSGSPTSKLLPTLSAKLWQYARRQKAWLRKLSDETI